MKVSYVESQELTAVFNTPLKTRITVFPPLRSEKLVFYCAKILINAGIRMGSCIHLCKRSLRACCLDSPEVRKPARSQEPHKCIMIFFSDCGRISSVGRLLDC